MSAEGRQHVVANFSMEQMVGRWEQPLSGPGASEVWVLPGKDQESAEIVGLR